MSIFEATDGIYPFLDKKTPEEIRESARLFYVAMTRQQLQRLLDSAYDVRGHGSAGRILDDPVPEVSVMAETLSDSLR